MFDMFKDFGTVQLEAASILEPFEPGLRLLVQNGWS
jgi:hypothetical protein